MSSDSTVGPHLVLNPGEPEERVFVLRAGDNVVGRDPQSEVRVLDASVSRRHASVELTAEGVLLRDLGSRNGVFVAGAPVQAIHLKGGERGHIGNVPFVFQLGRSLPPPPAPPPARSAPPPPLEAPAVGSIFVPEDPGDLDELPPPSVVRDVSATFATISLEVEFLRHKEGSRAARAGRARPDNRERDELRILLAISKLLSGPEPIEELLSKILDLLFELFEASGAVLLLIDEATGQLKERVSRTTSGEQAEGGYSRSIVDYVRNQGVAALFEDATRDSRFGRARSVLARTIRSVMSVPLKVKDRVIGVLYVDNVVAATSFVAADVELLAAFANQAAVAIENASLYRKIEEAAVVRNNLARFFPPVAVQRILASPGAELETIEAEVTVLFSDITGFTSMSSHMRPREVVALLNDYFPRMTQIVFRHEGTLEKYIGDALLAVWGVPFSREDDAARAVRAAVEMQQGVRQLNEWLVAQGRGPIDIHIGLNTGVVAAGNIGSEGYLQYATIGDATNVASRVCTAAEAGEILISASTHARLGAPALEALPPVQVKGKSEPLQLYRVPWK